MYKLDLPPDPKETAAIERRRNREQQRQSRIFNTRYRTMGVDLPTLERQVQERKDMEAAERARFAALDADRKECNMVALMLEQRENKKVRDINKAVQKFRDVHQQTESRRDFDLYDPEILKKDRPTRVCDEDPRCGPSSLQKFAGEDLNEKERKKLQTDLFNKYLKEQKTEREISDAQRKYADELFDKKRIELDERAQHLGKMEDECRKAMNIAMSNFNQALAREMSERRTLQKQQEEDNNFAEIYNNLTGDILTENPEIALSSFGPHRVVPDRWKGMSPEQVKAILNIQEQQRQEKQRLEEEEKQQDEEWDRQRTQDAHAAMKLEEQEDQLSRDIRKRMDERNQELSKVQRDRMEYLDKVVYTNNPTAHYHSQFNTSSR